MVATSSLKLLLLSALGSGGPDSRPPSTAGAPTCGTPALRPPSSQLAGPPSRGGSDSRPPSQAGAPSRGGSGSRPPSQAGVTGRPSPRVVRRQVNPRPVVVVRHGGPTFGAPGGLQDPIAAPTPLPTLPVAPNSVAVSPFAPPQEHVSPFAPPQGTKLLTLALPCSLLCCSKLASLFGPAILSSATSLCTRPRSSSLAPQSSQHHAPFFVSHKPLLLSTLAPHSSQVHSPLVSSWLFAPVESAAWGSSGESHRSPGSPPLVPTKGRSPTESPPPQPSPPLLTCPAVCCSPRLPDSLPAAPPVVPSQAQASLQVSSSVFLPTAASLPVSAPALPACLLSSSAAFPLTWGSFTKSYFPPSSRVPGSQPMATGRVVPVPSPGGSSLSCSSPCLTALLAHSRGCSAPAHLTALLSPAPPSLALPGSAASLTHTWGSFTSSQRTPGIRAPGSQPVAVG